MGLKVEENFRMTKMNSCHIYMDQKHI